MSLIFGTSPSGLAAVHAHGAPLGIVEAAVRAPQVVLGGILAALHVALAVALTVALAVVALVGALYASHLLGPRVVVSSLQKECE